ncbi:MAG: response regulator transcription factor [Bacteroidetes bacterium]|nr:response regulator transcription factor [Bacteroidota bacterium]
MKTGEKTILIVDDEQDIRDLLVYNMKKEGFNTIAARNGKEGLVLLESEKIDAVVLDLMMPVMDGLEMCKLVRANDKYNEIPILFLTAKDSEIDEVLALELGSDSYLKKPISPRVLISHIKALLRRSVPAAASTPQDVIRMAKIEIDPATYTVTYKGKSEQLPRKEFELLYFLAKNKNRIFSREQILNSVWGQDVIVGDRTVDVHVRKLRDKLYQDVIVTARGVGYKIND